MSHLDTAYKLGAVKAARDFEDWMQNTDYENPTAPPPKMGTRASMNDLPSPSEEIAYLHRIGQSRSNVRAPGGGAKSRFAGLKKRLAKRKRIRKHVPQRD